MDTQAVIGQIASFNSGTIGNINVVVNQQVKVVEVVEKFPDGSIGRNTAKRTYLSYLADRYSYYKMQEEQSAAGTPEYAAAKKAAYGRLNGAIKRQFGGYRTCLPASKFEVVADYLHACIDHTTAGQLAAAEGKSRYRSFAEHEALCA